MRWTLSIRRLLLSPSIRGGKDSPSLLENNDVPVDRRQWLGLPDRQKRLSECSTCVCRTRRRPECGWTTKAAAAALDFGSHPKQREAHQNIRDGEGNPLRLLRFIGRHFGLMSVMVCWPNTSSTFDCCDERPAADCILKSRRRLIWISPFHQRAACAHFLPPPPCRSVPFAWAALQLVVLPVALSFGCSYL